VSVERDVTIDNVRVVRDDAFVVVCSLDGRTFEIPKLMLRASIPLPGDVGRIVVPEWFARDHGLIA
jgi:hypothetical protein